MAKRGRPRLTDAKAARAFLRFAELLGEGEDVTAAERRMLEEHGWRELTSRQAVRKRCNKGEFLGFIATAMLAADFSYKHFRK